MVVFNLLGLLIALPAYGLGVVVAGLLLNEWHGYGVLPMLVGGAVALTADLAYRVTHCREEEYWRFIKPTTGGQLCWVPVWCLGVC